MSNCGHFSAFRFADLVIRDSRKLEAVVIFEVIICSE